MVINGLRCERRDPEGSLGDAPPPVPEMQALDTGNDDDNGSDDDGDRQPGQAKGEEEAPRPGE